MLHNCSVPSMGYIAWLQSDCNHLTTSLNLIKSYYFVSSSSSWKIVEKAKYKRTTLVLVTLVTTSNTVPRSASQVLFISQRPLFLPQIFAHSLPHSVRFFAPILQSSFLYSVPIHLIRGSNNRVWFYYQLHSSANVDGSYPKICTKIFQQFFLRYILQLCNTILNLYSAKHSVSVQMSLLMVRECTRVQAGIGSKCRQNIVIKIKQNKTLEIQETQQTYYTK